MKKTVIVAVLATVIAGAAAASLAGCSAPVDVKGRTFVMSETTVTYSEAYPEGEKKSTLWLDYTNASTSAEGIFYTFKEDGKFAMLGVDVGTYVQDGAKLTISASNGVLGQGETQECTVKGATIVASRKTYFKLEGETLLPAAETTEIYYEQTAVYKESKGDSVDGKTYKYSKIEMTAGGSITEEEIAALKTESEETFKNCILKFENGKCNSSNDGGASWEGENEYKQYGGVVVVNGERQMLDGDTLSISNYEYENEQDEIAYYCVVKVIFEVVK